MANKATLITIGNFDGVHRGHQAILRRARELAQPLDADVLAITFDPMPAAVLRPEAGPPHLGTIDQRIAALKATGVDQVLVIKPTREVLGQEAEQFIAHLIADHNAVGFVEGEDFCFGKKRAGNMTMLAELGKAQGFVVEAMPRVETLLSDQSVAPISSSLVRWLVGRGRAEDAAACLGRPFDLVGHIVQGDQRGRTIGVPTANLDPASYHTLITPMDGVYAGHVTLDGQTGTPHPAAISVGVKPTFKGEQLTIEAHLIGLTTGHPDALYGITAQFTFARWLRDQYPFPSVDALKAQLQRDIDHAAKTLAELADGYD